ncbi:MAG: hypothetical protein CV087_16790 [Candidatus Brocadia sp. WS118]|nr:MAG: hypothetical protein CV087_16790 [Candidatus Brocadia sp. WS118]
MAHDFFHHIVKAALEKDGWEITHDPYELRLDNEENKALRKNNTGNTSE